MKGITKSVMALFPLIAANLVLSLVADVMGFDPRNAFLRIALAFVSTILAYVAFKSTSLGKEVLLIGTAAVFYTLFDVSMPMTGVPHFLLCFFASLISFLNVSILIESFLMNQKERK